MLCMSSKERPSISDKFRRNLRDKATAAIIPLALVLPPTIEQTQEESKISWYSGNVGSGYENVITTFAHHAPKLEPAANEIVSFRKPLPEQQEQVFDGSDMVPAASVVEGIAERRLPYVPLWRQADYRWGWMRYGTASMADSGCAPTSLAMA